MINGYMPLIYNNDKKGNFVKWGNKGKKYYYYDLQSYLIARNKAIKQSKAIFANGYIK